MDIERTFETQRLRLLRIVAGLFVVVGFLAVGPVSRGFSDWIARYVGSILSRAESATRYLVITRASVIVSRYGLKVDPRLLSKSLDPELLAGKPDVSLSDCRRRLKVLRAILTDLPRHALHLLRRIEKRMRRALCAASLSPCPDLYSWARLCCWRLTINRIERPPDKRLSAKSQSRICSDDDVQKCLRHLSPPPEPRREAKAVKSPIRGFWFRSTPVISAGCSYGFSLP